MMVPKKQGVIINVSSMASMLYMFNVAYGVGKAAVDRMTADCAIELKKHQVAAVSLWPGPVMTEGTLDMFVSEKIKEVQRLPDYQTIRKVAMTGESQEYPGKCVVSLVQDPKIMKKTGKILMTAELGAEYKLTDIDGRTIKSPRSLSWLLSSTGWDLTSKLVPTGLKLPYLAFDILSSKFWGVLFR